MTKPNAVCPSEDWPVSWKENRRAQLRSTLKATPAQRLEWLEAALRLAAQTGALQRLRDKEMEEVRSLFPEAGRQGRPEKNR